MDSALWVLGAAAALLAVVLVLAYQYNRMVVLRNRIREAWSNVDTELRRRHDLVPNLVAAVKGYAAHERAVADAVLQARAAALAGNGRPAAQAASENALVSALDRLLALAEAYPRLQASANFLRLQEELAMSEDRIQAARRFYNANVRDYRNRTRQVPGALFASLFRMPEEEYFEVGSAHVRHPVPVAFAPSAGLGGA